MLTLEEAIAHCKEKAEEILKANEEMPTDCKLSEDLCECAREHEQLAEWLTELKELRETMEMIKEHYILVEKSPRDNPNEFIVGRVVLDNLQGWRYEEKENDKWVI